MMVRALAASLALLASTALVQAQTRPPSQKTGPLTIYGLGTTGDVSETSFRTYGGKSKSLGQLGLNYAGAKPTLGDVLAKMQNGVAVSMAFEGDSLIYGQFASGSPAANTRPGINGSSLVRANTSIPEALSQQLGNLGFTAATNITNRGYPGDNTVYGLSRWATAPTVDLVFIMYGTNDANNYGGLGVVTIPDYRTNMGLLIERRLAQGSAVVVLEPPPIQDRTSDAKLRAYASAARQVAREYGVPFMSMREAVKQIPGNIWSDGVHGNDISYNRMGASLTALFATRDESPLHVGPGTLLYPQSVMGPGGAIFVDARARTGQFYQLQPGEILSVPFHADTPVVPVITTFSTLAGDSHLRAYYETSKSGIPVTEMPNDSANNPRRSYLLPKFERGLQTLDFANQGVNVVFVESLRFEAPGSHVQASFGSVLSGGLAGKKRPVNGSGTGWYGVVDYSRKLNPGAVISSTMRLGTNNENGLSLMSDRDATAPYLSQNQIMFLRFGTSLIIREIVNSGITDTTTPGAFPAGEITADLEVLINSNAVYVFVNGLQVALKNNPAFSSGYAAWVSNNEQRTACLAMSVSD